MRVLIALDQLCGLPSRQAAVVIGEQFAALGAQVAVVPMAVGGTELVQALAELDPEAPVVACSTLDELIAELRDGTGRRYLDLTDAVVAAEELLACEEIPAAPEVAAVVCDSQVGLPLTGMGGALVTSARQAGWELGETIALNDRAEAWLAARNCVDDAGAGAHGGLGAVVLAAGGSVVSGVEACAAAANLDQVSKQADVVVTGCHQLDFHAVGGPVLQDVVQRGNNALRPVIAIVEQLYVSPRELRTVGIETAYVVKDPTPEGLSQTAKKVAVTWNW